MSSPAKKIKENLPIEEVISSYIKLERSGKNLRAKCPFHNEKTPSFFVSPERGTYYCFGCGAKGDIFTFVEDFEGIDFKGALKLLADKGGVELRPVNPKEAKEEDKIFEVLEETTLFYEKSLKENKKAIEYLKERGIEKDTIESFRLGYARDNWRDLLEHLKGKGFGKKEIFDSGVIVYNKEKNKVYDRFRGRIIFPIFDASGRVVAFSGRSWPEDKEGGAKYINSPETKLFKKSEILYGYDRARSAIRKYDFAIFVEGQTDLIMSHQAGYRNTVASSGTSLTRNHFEKILKITPNVVLAPDADEAGMKSLKRSSSIALSLGMDVKVAPLPKGDDPADVISRDQSLWKKTIKNSVHVIDYLIERINDQDFDDRKRKKEMVKGVLPYVKIIGNNIDRDHFIKKIAGQIGVTEKIINDEIKNIKKPDDSLEPDDSNKKGSLVNTSSNFLEDRIEAIILWQDSLKDGVDTSQYKKAFKEISGREVGRDKVEREDKIYEAEFLFGQSEDVDGIMREMISRAKEDKVKEEMSKVMMDIKKEETKNKKGDTKKLLKKYQALLEKLARLKNNKDAKKEDKKE